MLRYDAIRTSHTRNSTHVLTTGRLSFHTAGRRSQERSGIRTRLKDKLWLNATRTVCFVLHLVLQSASWPLLRETSSDRHDGSFSPTGSTVDGYRSSDAALSECCATWYTWLRACEAWWTSRCNMLARHSTLHVRMCPLIAPQDMHGPCPPALTFARVRDLCLACSADLSGTVPLLLLLHT